jgi:BASS family bile acid:Na+ symporter
VVVFNLLSLLIGYGVPRLAEVDRRAAIAAGFEIGIHNTALALTVAVSPALLNSSEMAIPAVVYGIVMFFTAAGFGWLNNRRASVSASRVPVLAGAKPGDQSSAMKLSARRAKR